MTLPTVAGVQSRIHTIPERPPFMLIREMAEALGLVPDSLSKAFRRNREKFPRGYFFVLTKEEYLAQFGQNVRTAERARTDLEQTAFTEKGALFLLRFVTGEAADAGTRMIIEAFVTQRDEQAERLRSAALKLKTAYIGRSKMKLAILLAAEAGWTFGKLWGEHEWSAPALGRAIEEMRTLGYIPAHALFVPPYVFAFDRRKAEVANLDVHAEDNRQARLALEG